MHINLYKIRVYVCLAFFLCFFSSCAYKQISYQRDSRLVEKKLCILLPENPVVFEDLSSCLYRSLWDHFQRVGYQLSTSLEHAYRLRTVICKVESIDKLISPDVQPYGFRVMLVVECFLYNKQGRLLATKKINQYRWIYKPANPLYSREYVSFQYQRLCDTIPIRIDHFIRPLLVSEKDEDA